MEKFIRLTAKACPLMMPNLNTDQILPARFLKWPRAKVSAASCFETFDTMNMTTSTRIFRSINNVIAMPGF